MMRYVLWLLFLSFFVVTTDGSLHVKIEQPQLPVLAGKAQNPVMKLTFYQTGNVHDGMLERLSFLLHGTDNIEDIEYAALYEAKKNGLIDTKRELARTSCSSEGIVFENIALERDTVACWLALHLRDTIDLDGKIRIMPEHVKTEKGTVLLFDVVCKPLRTGVAVRQHGQDGVHTSRIPGLITSKNGTLLLMYDARNKSSRDLQGDIDIAINRSFDGGRTWQPMQIVLDQGEWGGLPEKYNGVSDGCILLDETTGDIYVAGLWMYGVLDGKSGKWIPGLTEDSKQWIHQWHTRGSQPGLGVKETCQFLIVKSSDDGATWSAPVNITSATKRKEWWLFAPAPGHGLTLSDGTLLFPTQGRDGKGMPFSNITYSKDGGKTWRASNPAYSDVTECMAVELDDGDILLNMRDNRNRGNTEDNGRRICVTSDLGDTWKEHPTSRNALIEPTCMGSIHKHVYPDNNGVQKSIYLFSNPNSVAERVCLTLKVSTDNCKTWPEEKWILLDEYKSRGYSCITSVSEDYIGIVYESSQADLVYQRIAVDELLK